MVFDEFVRELGCLELEQGVQVPIDIPLDDKGYIDRECPHSECGELFKVLFDDWRDKVPDVAAFCPKCGARDDPSQFNTETQSKYIQQAAETYVAEQLNQAFDRRARRTKPRKISAGGLDIQMSVSYHAGPTPVVLPSSALEVLRQDFQCKSCCCRYSTIGAGYFCPACGHNSAAQDFDHTIDTTLKVVDSLKKQKLVLTDMYNLDVAVNIEQQLLEDQIENLVTAFQRASEALFSELQNATSFNFDRNVFQRLRDGSELWSQATGTAYKDHLTKSELEEMATMFERRHKLSHTQGIVDQAYVDKSGDSAYEVGQKLVIREVHVRRLSELVKKLVDGLRDVVAKTGRSRDLPHAQESTSLGRQPQPE